MSDDSVSEIPTIAAITFGKYNDIFSKGDLFYWECAYEKAKEHFQSALNHPSISLPDLARCYNSLGAVDAKLQDYEEAINSYRKQLDILMKLEIPKKNDEITKCYVSIGMVYSLRHDYAQAIDYHQKALDSLSETTPISDQISNIHSNLANLYVKTNEFELAAAYFEKALEIDRQYLREDHPKFGQTYADIGAMFYSKQDYKQALNYFVKAHETWLKSLSSSHIYITSMEKTIRTVQSKLDHGTQPEHPRVSGYTPIFMDINTKTTKSKETNPNQSDKRNPFKSLDKSDQLRSDANVSVGQPVSDTLSNTTSDSANSSHRSRSSSFPFQPETLIDDRLEQIRLKYEIKQDLIQRLRKLESYKIILLCDDSGSMNTPVDKKERTRWDELYDFVQIILEIGIIFNPTGVDIYFLHRKPLLNVTDRQIIKETFSQSPSGGCTPLVSVLRHLFQLPATRRGNDRKALVFIATDGAPTDEKGNDNLDELEYLMNHERQIQTTHVMFLICTDDPDCIEYLTNWDKTMKNVDVTDNFKSERYKVRKYRGSKYPFSKGDYIVKALLGAIDPYIYGINEPSPEIHFN